MSNLSIRTKLLLSFSATVLIAVIIGIFGYWGIKQSQSNIHEIGVIRLPSVNTLQNISEAQSGIRADERVLLNPYFTIEYRKHQYYVIQEKWKTIKINWNIYAQLPQTKEEAVLWQEFIPVWKNVESPRIDTILFLLSGSKSSIF